MYFMKQFVHYFGEVFLWLYNIEGCFWLQIYDDESRKLYHSAKEAC